ncbi:MAG: DUF6497 family protein [Halocynthiibacter sp.]
MRKLYLLFGAIVLLTAAGLLALRQEPAGQTGLISVPSGQDVRFQEVIWGQRSAGGLAVRFRFLAPEIARSGGRISFDEAVGDMQDLCDNYALRRISELGPRPAQIIISLSDRPVPFAEPDPGVTQYFEAYRIENTVCVWEGF